ncbi:MAG: RIP metalloprotease RseP, partial [Candidatus Hydrogenedentes bacterium]|nr:RIP metalloprotease RseP [Candidatus Hydrogenedentota bacterium]
MLMSILPFLIVLGLLVFFHELGHFLAAKACGIYVDRFSLGMPPRIWGFKYGETDYCVGALPIGGYVKMAGQEDSPMDDEQREKEYGHVPPDRWFNKKPIWQRVIVIAAGPFMNLVLAVLLYGIAGSIGENVPESKVDTRIGSVEPDSPAAKAPLFRIATSPDAVDTSAKPDDVGWQTGDRILSIGGRTTTAFEDVALNAMLSSGNMQPVVIERADDQGRATQYLSLIKPETLPGATQLRFGVSPFSTAVVDTVSDGLPAQQQGLQKGDVITKLDGKTVDALSFRQRVTKLTAGEALTIQVERDGKLLDFELKPQIIGRFEDLAFTTPVADKTTPDDAPLVIAGLNDTLREKTKLRSGDIVVDIDGRPANAGLMRELERTSAGKTVTATVKSPPRFHGLFGKEEIRNVSLDLTPVGVVGVVFGEKLVFRKVSLAQALPESLTRCRKALDVTFRSIGLLVTGNVSPKELGGPIQIYRVTTMAAQEGLTRVTQIAAFISINLAVFNILPLPVLDGGLLVFLTLEGIRRKPLDIRVLERIQQVGIAFILFLFLFVTY